MPLSSILNKSGLPANQPAQPSAFFESSLRFDRFATRTRSGRRLFEDHSEKAFEETIDRLLASPHYGENGAGTGLIWSAAETNGYERDGDKP